MLMNGLFVIYFKKHSKTQLTHLKPRLVLLFYQLLPLNKDKNILHSNMLLPNPVVQLGLFALLHQKELSLLLNRRKFVEMVLPNIGRDMLHVAEVVELLGELPWSLEDMGM